MKKQLLFLSILLVSIASFSQNTNEDFKPSGDVQFKVFWNYHADFTNNATKTSAFEFDPMTKELFQKSKQSEALTNILSNKELFTRNAAGHFWFNKSLIGAIKTIKINADKLIKTLQLELEKR